MLSFRKKLCYNEENNPNKKRPARCGTLCSKRKEVEGMKYRWMVVCLCACLVLFSGCASRKGEEDALPRQEVELVDEAGEEAPETQPEETPEEEPETKPEETPSQPEQAPRQRKNRLPGRMPSRIPSKLPSKMLSRRNRPSRQLPPRAAASASSRSSGSIPSRAR